MRSGEARGTEEGTPVKGLQDIKGLVRWEPQNHPQSSGDLGSGFSTAPHVTVSHIDTFFDLEMLPLVDFALSVLLCIMLTLLRD